LKSNNVKVVKKADLGAVSNNHEHHIDEEDSSHDATHDEIEMQSE